LQQLLLLLLLRSWPIAAWDEILLAGSYQCASCTWHWLPAARATQPMFCTHLAYNLLQHVIQHACLHSHTAPSSSCLKHGSL
jgi:hypothetical protein